jgi:hypothetical protein
MKALILILLPLMVLAGCSRPKDPKNITFQTENIAYSGDLEDNRGSPSHCSHTEQRLAIRRHHLRLTED